MISVLFDNPRAINLCICQVDAAKLLVDLHADSFSVACRDEPMRTIRKMKNSVVTEIHFRFDSLENIFRFRGNFLVLALSQELKEYLIFRLMDFIDKGSIFPAELFSVTRENSRHSFDVYLSSQDSKKPRWRAKSLRQAQDRLSS